MDLFKKLAEALGEPVENVYNMQERERSELMIAMQIDVTVAVMPVKQPTDEPGTSRSQGSAGDKGDPSVGNKKRKKQKSGGSRRLPFDYDSDNDFVPDDSERNKKFKFNYDEMASDFRSVYDDGSKPSSSRRRPARLAAQKADTKNKNLDNDEIASLLDDTEGSVEPPFRPADSDFSRRPQKTHTESPARVEKVTGTKLPNLDHNNAEDYSILLKKINREAKRHLLIDHVRDPSKLLEEDLPKLNIAELRKGAGKSQQKDTERSLKVHFSVLKGVSDKGLVVGSVEPLSWLKLSTSRKKTLPVKWVKEEERQIEVCNEDAFFDLNLDEPLISRVENKSKVEKEKEVNVVSPVPAPSTSTWLSKADPSTNGSSQGSRLRLKKLMTETSKIEIDKVEKQSMEQKDVSDEMRRKRQFDAVKPSMQEKDDEIRRKKLFGQINQHLELSKEEANKKNENDDIEIEIVKEVASPHCNKRGKEG